MALGRSVGVPAFARGDRRRSLQSLTLFAFGVMLIGFGGGLFGHGTLTLTMNRAPKEQVGLALGAWGAVQATAAGAAWRSAASAATWCGAGRARRLRRALATPATGYAFVYAIEMVLLLATVVAMMALVRSEAGVQRQAASHDNNPASVERALKVTTIIFIVWAIVFVFWGVRQFSAHNKKKVLQERALRMG